MRYSHVSWLGFHTYCTVVTQWSHYVFRPISPKVPIKRDKFQSAVCLCDFVFWVKYSITKHEESLRFTLTWKKRAWTSDFPPKNSLNCENHSIWENLKLEKVLVGKTLQAKIFELHWCFTSQKTMKQSETADMNQHLHDATNPTTCWMGKEL